MGQTLKKLRRKTYKKPQASGEDGGKSVTTNGGDCASTLFAGKATGVVVYCQRDGTSQGPPGEQQIDGER